MKSLVIKYMILRWISQIMNTDYSRWRTVKNIAIDTILRVSGKWYYYGIKTGKYWPWGDPIKTFIFSCRPPVWKNNRPEYGPGYFIFVALFLVKSTRTVMDFGRPSLFLIDMFDGLFVFVKLWKISTNRDVAMSAGV